MTIYKTVLFASDFSVDNLVMAHRAKHLADGMHATMHIVHVIERPVMYAHMFSSIDQVIAEQIKHAKVIMDVFCDNLNISYSNTHILVGNTKTEIANLIKKLNVDLLVLGSHGVGGYTHILGSVAQHMVNTAPCSVLTLDASAVTDADRQAEKIYYQRKLPFGVEYTEQGLAHGRTPSKIKDSLPKDEGGPKLWGSKRGIHQEIKRGPKPSHRMPGTPYGPVDDEESGED